MQYVRLLHFIAAKVIYSEIKFIELLRAHYSSSSVAKLCKDSTDGTK